MRHRSLFLRCILAAALVLAACGCRREDKAAYAYEKDPSLAALVDQEPAAYPEVHFVVFSDPHVFDPSLVKDGAAFQQYVTHDRKLLAESAELMEAVVNALRTIPAEFVLIAGDLTKDGEASSHRLVADALHRIEATGKDVYVVPGNHDILNYGAVRYRGDGTEPVPSVTPDEFVQLYQEYGFGDAVLRDPSSLSYVAEPVPGLWLLALDTCRYMEHHPGQSSIGAGRLSQSSLRWVETVLSRAAQESKAVMAMSHHGLVEHYRGQAEYFPSYVIEDHQRVTRLLAAYDVRLAFTGHYHAQDVTVVRHQSPDGFLFDVETGSLVTYPLPYRHVHIDAQQTATLRTMQLRSIASRPEGLTGHARDFTRAALAAVATDVIMEYDVGHAEAERLADQVALAYLAHYAGDEELPAGQQAIDTSGLSLRGWLVVLFRRGMVEALWHDLPPPDNDLVIDLRTGEWE
jgi:3',5'-cyclic AMP phosphodiesterase CpdA